MPHVHETYNLTPFVAEFKFSKSNEGQDLIIGIVKAGFDVDGQGNLTIAPNDRMLPVMVADRFHDNDENKGVRYPADVTPEKEGTDIIINGHAYGYGQKQVNCGFTLGYLKKTLRVSGDREWARILRFYKMIGPIPFEKIPLTYENAFGGRYEDKKGEHLFEYNPVGKGFGAKHLEKPLLPNIEYTDRPVRLISHQPKPAGFGAIPMSWKQRRELAGTFDETWRSQRFPLAPCDMNPGFYNAAPSDQVFKPKLKGLEKLTLFNIHRSNPKMTLTIPKMSFITTVRIRQERVAQPMEIDTCLIEPDENRLTLTYISRIPCDVDPKYLKSVHFEPV
jgi:hypothetical protein